MQGSHQGKWVYPLGRRCVLGRHAECDISDLFNDNTNASRIHAVVETAGGQYFVEDNGSRNGTYLNGKRLTARAPLRSGDRLGIAGVELTFLDEADAATAIPVDPAGAARLDRVSYAEPASPPIPLSSLAVKAPGFSGPFAGYSADKLRGLVQMLKRLGRSLDVTATLNELLSGLFAMFPQAQRAVVAFTTDGHDDVTPRATYFHREEVDPRVGISRTLMRHVLSRREAILWAEEDPASGLATTGTLTDLCIRSLLCAPLLDGDGNPFGVVQIDTDQPQRKFTSEDLEVMVGAVSQAAVAVRFAKLHEEGLRRQAVERDLELARRVQLGLLPEGYPDREDYEFFAYYRSAYEVGGDYYDFIELPNERLALVVADVAGKGVSAALLMAKLSGELKYHLSCDTPGTALGRMNEVLCAGGTDRFVTLLAAILDYRRSMLTLVNAGHPAPLRRRSDGRVEAVGESGRGPALGLVPDRDYVEIQVPVEPGDVWIAYTDGFSEAANTRGEMFGALRLRERLAQAPGVVQESGRRIVQEVLGFLGDQPQSDDMCLIGWGR
ncbi:MAG TPA: SpoIIE family protein phosphatase, partial [Gemmataceae bacterium]|nr:SpoIIE family protein phosphatase [Gemmataceae bacterium]